MSYLGGEMPTFALNFSRPGAQVLLQYYLFLRLGFQGYRRVQQVCSDVARHLAARIGEMPAFQLWNDGSDIPVFGWSQRPGHTDNWDLHHLSDRLRMKGWLVPAYPMPADLESLTVQRVVVRNGFSRDLADAFLADLAEEVDYLDSLQSPMPGTGHPTAFHH